MKTKQAKEESEKSIDEDAAVEPKTRARKKASDVIDEDKSKNPQDEPKTSKETKKNAGKPRALVKKRPLGIRKTLRNKKIITAKDLKSVIKQKVKRGRKPALKQEADNSIDKDTVPLIPASEIKKEPVDEAPTSRSSSPKTAGRRQRLTSDMAMMKSVLGDSPSSLVLGPRTSPYSMRSERSNSPSMFEGKNLRSGKPRKVKNNLLNEVVMKEQKKRRRLLSESKAELDTLEDGKKLKRVRSCSRDGSEISKCSDITESDISLNEPLNETDGKELNKKLDKPKTDLDVDIENNVQISTIEKVPSLNDSKLAELNMDNSLNDKKKKKMSLKRSTSLDSDNNNSNRLKLENLHSSDIEDKLLMKTENDTLFEARSSILTSMSKTFNSKEVSKNIRKARRGRKAGVTGRASAGAVSKPSETTTLANEVDDKQETLETLSKEINDLINNLDENIDRDHEMTIETNVPENSNDQMQAKQVSKFYGLSKPLGDNNSITSIALPDTPVKDKDAVSPVNSESTPSKIDDSENIRLHYDDDSQEKCDEAKQEITFKVTPVASIDKLMDRLKEFEEFDKRRQRQESESKSSESKPMMVTNDVVLIPKSGADFKPLKDIQTIKSPERAMGNVLSCFENNSAISIVKRDHVRKSVDIDLTNSVTLIKRNSISSRKESTSSDQSKEADAISIFEKSLGKDVTLTEIRKSVEKPPQLVDLNQLATLQPAANSSLSGVLDSNQISITPRPVSEVQVTKRKSRDSTSRKSSESNVEPEEKLAIIEKIKSLVHIANKTPTPVAVKSPEAVPMETEALPPPPETKSIPHGIPRATDLPKADSVSTEIIEKAVIPADTLAAAKDKVEKEDAKTTDIAKKVPIVAEVTEKSEASEKSEEKSDGKKTGTPKAEKKDSRNNSVLSESAEVAKPGKSPGKGNKSARNSIESVAGPSNILVETPESQKHKENVLRTLGLLTHKAAKEAKIEKLKEKERIYSGIASKGKGKSASGEYTGTLKTVIKLNRGIGDRDKKKYRSSLKMTFQKSKNRSGKPELSEAAEHDEYYTIERREAATGSEGGHRKTHYSNRLNHDPEAAPEPVEPTETLNLVIPEKASSFSIHPGRLCMDQCFYCGGKFGLFDTPCHIAQMKSADRQKKVLDNEEKLTIDSCLCDACYRHVDRRANCPSYRKRPLNKPQPDLKPTGPTTNSEREKANSPPAEDESDEESPTGGGAPAVGAGAPGAGRGRPAACHTAGCGAPADNSIRRKWLIKMRSSVSKVLQLEGDYPGLHTIPLCAAHHALLAPLLACALCRRRLTRHHAHHSLHHGIPELNASLKEAGIPVEIQDRPVLCKMCRYYCTLLQRTQHNDKHARQYRRKLLQIYKIEVPPESENEADESSMLEEANNSVNRQKKKARNKSKQRKPSDPDRSEDSNERTSESKDKSDESNDAQKANNMEEDIESLISSNKIPVPGAKVNDQGKELPMECSDPEGIYDFDGPLMAYDKQTELQILLQKQNNPAQFMHKTNLTQKQKNLMKIHQMSGVQKPGQLQRIHDKNAKKIQKIGQIITHKDRTARSDGEMEPEKNKEKESVSVFKNISLNDECSIESIPNKKPADINTLKNKWQMSESFTQVKRNLSELSKKNPTDKEKKSFEAKYSNPVRRLETNPSISVRELFPGEEEMNLQCNVEFNNVKGVTPEGWEKCNTTIQYDMETKKLWNELQRPYGNQSSFLRHLILLEKYFRSGDLVLSQNASSNATNYSDSVQNRVRSYDNIPDPPKRTETSKSLIEFRKKPAVNGKSLLKSNQSETEKEPKKSMPPPPGAFPKPKPPKADKVKAKALPPELIAINTPNAQGRKAIQNVLHNIQQLVKGVSASDPTEVAAAPLPSAQPHPPTMAPSSAVVTPQKEEKKETKSDTPKKQKTSKLWRPTLMPITPENLSRIAREPKQRAVDGRELPSLVQVMSAGRRYHITLTDYNKMCVMRREKLAQLQPDPERSAALCSGGTVLQNVLPDRDEDLSHLGSNAANILKNVGLKNITIAPIPAKTATVTSQTASSLVSSPALLVTSTPMKLPQLGASVSITSEGLTMPKIPKSLTVIPQSLIAPPSVTVTASTVMPTPSAIQTSDGPRP